MKTSVRQLLVLLAGLWVWSVWACTGCFADIVQSYPAYVRETAPLTQKLISLGPLLSGQLVSLQRLAAINHELHLLRTNYRWERGEQNLFSAQLMKTALDALDDAVQFWHDGNDLRYLMGENENFMPFDQAFIQSRLKRVLDCIDDLKTLQSLRDTLDKPTMRYQKRPEFTDTRQPLLPANPLIPDDTVLPTQGSPLKRRVTPSLYNTLPKKALPYKGN